ncbi:MAG: AI-2E family transporter [Ignavibacteria bacterium]|nr:AI-2E family transporter [Ignavibacteria bacterium]
MSDSNRKFFVFVGGAILTCLGVFVLIELQSILLPFFIAIIISFLFLPVFEWLKSKKLPSWLALTIVMILILLLANVSSLFIFTSISAFESALPEYQQKFDALYNSIFASLASMGIDVDGLKTTISSSSSMSFGNLTSIATSLFSSIAGIFGDFVLIMIYVVFLLSEFSSINRRILVAFSADKARKIVDTFNDIFNDVRRYLVGKTIINLIEGFVIGVILWAFGVDFYVVWGILVFLMNYIPNIGSFIATVLPFITALFNYDNIIMPIIILVIMIAVANIFGNMIEPKVFGDTLDLSPILILVALIFWGYVWGIMGMILSIPIMSMIKIIMMKFDATRPAAILMSYNLTRFNKKNPGEEK